MLPLSRKRQRSGERVGVSDGDRRDAGIDDVRSTTCCDAFVFCGHMVETGQGTNPLSREGAAAWGACGVTN